MTTYSPASVRCREVIPSERIECSRAAGWTSVYLDHHRDLPDDAPFQTLATPDQTIVVMLSGEQAVESFAEGIWRPAVYQAGTVGMTPGGETDRLRRRVRRDAVSVEKATLYIPQGHFQEAGDHYRRAGQRRPDQPLNSLAFDDALIAQCVLALVRAMRAGAPNLYAQATAQWLAVHLLSAHATWRGIDAGARHAGMIRDRRLARVIGYMTEHLNEAITLDALALEAAVSKFHFSRLFRQHTGVAPHAFLVELRMDAARRLLSTTDLSVKEIATRCGFPRAAHFGTAFTKKFGLSPMGYRTRYRR